MTENPRNYDEALAAFAEACETEATRYLPQGTLTPAARDAAAFYARMLSRALPRQMLLDVASLPETALRDLPASESNLIPMSVLVRLRSAYVAVAARGGMLPQRSGPTSDTARNLVTDTHGDLSEFNVAHEKHVCFQRERVWPARTVRIRLDDIASDLEASGAWYALELCEDLQRMFQTRQWWGS